MPGKLGSGRKFATARLRPGMGSHGFTLIEMIVVIIVVAIVSAIAISRLVSLEGSARSAGVRGALGAVRTAITLYYNRSGLPPPRGSNKPYFPTLDMLKTSDAGPGLVLESNMPDNPCSTNVALAARNDLVGKNAAVADGAHPDPAATTGAWAYDSFKGAAGSSPEGEPYGEPPAGFDIGQFWADTNTSGIQEYQF